MVPQPAQIPPNAVQLTDYCFNIVARCFAHQIANRQERSVVYANGPRPINLTKAFGNGRVYRADEKKDSVSLLRNLNTDTTPTEPLTVEATGYLAVGLTLHPALQERRSLAPRVIRGRPIGHDFPVDALITHDPDNEDILLVVTPMVDTNPGHTKLYALLGFKDGLFLTWNVAQDNVYYFSEFRDSSGTTEQRRTGWNKLVGRARLRTDIEDPDVEDTPTVGSAESEVPTTRQGAVQTYPNLFFAIEMVMLTCAVALHRNPGMLEQIRQIIHTASLRPLIMSPALDDFAQLKDGFSLASAESLVVEVERLWPELELNAATVLELHGGLHASGTLFVEYRYVGAVLAVFHMVRRLPGVEENES